MIANSALASLEKWSIGKLVVCLQMLSMTVFLSIAYDVKTLHANTEDALNVICGNPPSLFIFLLRLCLSPRANLNVQLI